MLRKINGKDFYLQETDFPIIPHREWFNLIILSELPELERQAAMIREIKGDNRSITFNQLTHGAWLVVELSNSFDMFKVSCANEHTEALARRNLELHGILDKVLFIEQKDDLLWELEDGTKLSATSGEFYWKQSEKWLSGPGISRLHESHVLDKTVDFDNLINLLIMVKNAGKLFRTVLTQLLPLFDYWTILDTGSTDGTQSLIKEVFKDKPGTLYEEPFVDFKASRNRLLELAGKRCKFNLMLDDTYIPRGNLRQFLQVIRGDQYGNSYSLYIRSYDSEYSSNRITKPEYNLRYIYRIHEVIDPKNNVNVMIPNDMTYVEDLNNDYMKNRTEERKQWDLQMLEREIQDDPEDPRALYYMAQTYKCLENWPKTYEYYLKRIAHSNQGFLQEKVDAAFEAGRTANYQLNRPWKECKELYKLAYRLDKSRPDSLYFLGIHYQLVNKLDKAFRYFKKAFRLGYPVHCQYSLKPTLSFHFLPKFLTPLCYQFKKWKLGLASSTLFCQKNSENDPNWAVQKSWEKIFERLILLPSSAEQPAKPIKPIVVFCADGNWNPWSGRDLEERGLGGSETWVVQSAREYKKRGYDVFVFCRCSYEEANEGVYYYDLSRYSRFISENIIAAAFVSRFSEWLPLTYEGRVEQVYLWVHDLYPSGLVIPDHRKLKYICGLTEWHQELLRARFPTLKNKIAFCHYGIDGEVSLSHTKIRNRFIYSSTANRGLFYLLKLWPRVKQLLPDATLEIFCDVDLAWANTSAPQELASIKQLIYSEGVIYRGWQRKAQLEEGWQKAQYWVYPCTFEETFCLTALQAAKYRVLPITNGLAALSETARRGVTIHEDAKSDKWADKLIAVLQYLKNNQDLEQKMLTENQDWANSLTWGNQIPKI